MAGDFDIDNPSGYPVESGDCWEVNASGNTVLD
jgi:hypothetical protein